MLNPPATLLTGLPRSGTTLTTLLLSQQPNTVALAEPLRPSTMSADPATFADEVEQWALATRRRALTKGVADSRAVRGKLAGNFVERRSRRGLRKPRSRRSEIKVPDDLTPDFRLYIKHPAAFTALVGPLSARFPFFACVRHPLAVLAAWQTVDMNINRGRVPMAERFLPDVRASLDALPTALERQVFLIGWFLDQYADLPPENILRFEDLALDPTAALAHVCPGARVEHLELETQDIATRYPSVDIDRLRDVLRPLDRTIRRYYPEGPPLG